MSENDKIALIVTGSIAAIKTLPLIDELRGAGRDVSVILTRAPQEWDWVKVDELKDATGNPVLTEDDSTAAKEKTILAAGTVLVVPASADFISQFVHESTPLACALLSALRKGRDFFFAPAMNVWMWGHPATQRNCAAAEGAGVKIIGPACGHMACGDEGYGRMADVKEIAEAIAASQEGRPHQALSYYDDAKKDPRGVIPVRPDDGRVLVVLAGETMPWPSVKELVNDLSRTGIAADYVLDPNWTKHKDELEALINEKCMVNGQECQTREESVVYYKHFQDPDLEGMEHIKIPESKRLLFFPFIDDELAVRMLQGRGGTLCLDMYLASKAPIVTTAECLRHLAPFTAASLRKDGMETIDHVGRLVCLNAHPRSPGSQPH
ncbi:MAG: flavoprotein [Alphaproteobacteria bacterium]|nr:flavoprotein [Alphaproteobacteria bacterium]